MTFQNFFKSSTQVRDHLGSSLVSYCFKLGSSAPLKRKNTLESSEQRLCQKNVYVCAPKRLLLTQVSYQKPLTVAHSEDIIVHHLERGSSLGSCCARPEASVEGALALSTPTLHLLDIQTKLNQRPFFSLFSSFSSYSP